MSASTSTPDRQWVAARRAAVRTLHPDRGGDPDAFIAALAAIDTTHGHLRGLDVPLIVIVRHPRCRRVVALIHRTMHAISGPRHHYIHL